MAKQTLLLDDLTGASNATTRLFGLDGVEYEIDLATPGYNDLKAALKPFIAAGRKAENAKKKRAKKKAPAAPSEAAAIRAWARSKRMKVTERGRVAPELREKWIEAGSPIV